MSLSPENRVIFNRIWSEAAKPPHETFFKALNRALDAARAEGPCRSVPDGWRLAPLDPPSVAVWAGAEAIQGPVGGSAYDAALKCWQSILAAAPPPGEGEVK